MSLVTPKGFLCNANSDGLHILLHAFFLNFVGKNNIVLGKDRFFSCVIIVWANQASFFI
uniref:Uncharacterized protein n=1 Tax=Rhizophora mucronata TaxID=61149 RepID=A0A2P2J6Y0_RHIMU